MIEYDKDIIENYSKYVRRGVDGCIHCIENGIDLCEVKFRYICYIQNRIDKNIFAETGLPCKPYKSDRLLLQRKYKR